MLRYDELDKRIADYLPDVPVLCDESLSGYCSFRIGGRARRMAMPKSAEQLVLLDSFARDCGMEPLLLGIGTNVLFPDEGLERFVICTREMTEVQLLNERTIRASAGVTLSRLAMFACRNSLAGLEFAHGIPGSVGGAVCMNAGAYGGEMGQVISQVEILFPNEGVRRIPCEEMAFGYRHSLLDEQPDAVVLSADFLLTPGDASAIREKMEELMQRRKASQPLEYPSAGSTFKRPAGYYAGTLIQEADLKGFAVGDAQVSEKHAGFVINRGCATCADVLQLIDRVQKRVYAKFGVRLEPEVRIIKE